MMQFAEDFNLNSFSDFTLLPYYLLGKYWREVDHGVKLLFHRLTEVCCCRWSKKLAKVGNSPPLYFSWFETVWIWLVKMYGPTHIVFFWIFVACERPFTYEIQALNSQQPSEAILHLAAVLMSCMLDGLTGWKRCDSSPWFAVPSSGGKISVYLWLRLVIFVNIVSCSLYKYRMSSDNNVLSIHWIQ